MLIKVFALGFGVCMILAGLCLAIDYRYSTPIDFAGLACGLILAAIACQFGFVISGIYYLCRLLIILWG